MLSKLLPFRPFSIVDIGVEVTEKTLLIGDAGMDANASCSGVKSEGFRAAEYTCALPGFVGVCGTALAGVDRCVDKEFDGIPAKSQRSGRNISGQG
jgi:hypothetical protein